mgnify:CR=1
MLDSSSEMFASGKGLVPDPKSEIKALQPKIGEIMCSLRGCGAAGSMKKRISTRVNWRITPSKGYASCFLECLRIYFALIAVLKVIALLPEIVNRFTFNTGKKNPP